MPRARGSESHVLVVERLAVDALGGRRDPARDLAALVARDHQRAHEGAVGLRGQPLADLRVPRRLVDALSLRVEARLREHPDAAVEAPVGEHEAEVEAVTLADL